MSPYDESDIRYFDNLCDCGAEDDETHHVSCPRYEAEEDEKEWKYEDGEVDDEPA
jgi:hypothetical protein